MPAPHRWITPLRAASPLPAVLVLALPLLLQGGCSRSSPTIAVAPQVQEISSEAAGDTFTVFSTDRSVYLTYPDLATLSLDLLQLRLPDAPATGTVPPLSILETTYLDRISETPEITDSFGIAALAMKDGLLNVFYSDREREGTPVLKWVSGPTLENKWWIDILPYPGEPLAVLPAGEDDLDLYLFHDGALSRRSLATGQARELLNPCEPAAEVCALTDPSRQGITVFDRSSQRLYALLHGDGRETSEVVYTAGAAHHALLRDGRLRVLLFSPADSTLLLLEERRAGDSSTFAATPVTLCEGTTSVYLGYAADLPFFLYNERAVDHEGDAGGHLLSLLTPSTGQDGETRYRRSELLNLETPIRRFRVSSAGPVLYVFFVQDTLKVLAVDLALLSSE